MSSNVGGSVSVPTYLPVAPEARDVSGCRAHWVSILRKGRAGLYEGNLRTTSGDVMDAQAHTMALILPGAAPMGVPGVTRQRQCRRKA